jgi:D-lactate dehydrogenase
MLEVRLAYARALEGAGQLSNAEKIYRSTLESKNLPLATQADMHFCLGVVLNRQRKFGDAVTELQKAIVINDAANSHLQLGAALMLALNRKLIRANSRVHDLNFSLEGLTGFDMNGKTVGVIGTGEIGKVVIKILNGFGCNILAFDKIESPDMKEKYQVVYTSLDDLYQRSDIITLHVPLIPETRYLINSASIAKMKQGVMLINTSRGALVNTKEVIGALKTGKIGYLGLDVYEEEAKLFFQDHSEDILQDDVISRLLTFKNVLITSHQAFLTDTAVANIAETTIFNLDCFEKNIECPNEL